MSSLPVPKLELNEILNTSTGISRALNDDPDFKNQIQMSDFAYEISRNKEIKKKIQKDMNDLKLKILHTDETQGRYDTSIALDTDMDLMKIED